LGYTRVTMVETKCYEGSTQSKSSKSTPVRIVFWNSKTWSWNR